MKTPIGTLGVSVENLLKGIVTLSGNDATVVLAECISGNEAAFVQLMNRQSQAMGLTNSHWGNPVGWPDNGVTYTTARDLAIDRLRAEGVVA